MITGPQEGPEQMWCYLSGPDVSSGGVLDLLALAHDLCRYSNSHFHFKALSLSTHSWDPGFPLYIQ